jgi:hypothetical protein
MNLFFSPKVTMLVFWIEVRIHVCSVKDGEFHLSIKDSNGSDALTIPLGLARYMIHIRHRLPTTDEITTLKQYFLIKGDAPWNLSSSSDQVADKFINKSVI